MDNKLSLLVQFSGLDQLSPALRSMIGLGRTGGQALGALKREARDLNGQLSKVRAEMAGASGNVSQLVQRERELEAQIARVNRQAERQKTLLAIDGNVAKMQARGASLKASGQENMIGGAGMLAPFVLAGKAAMDFSSGMVDIQQKADLTNRETAQMARNLIRAADAAHQMPEAMRAGVDVLAGMGMDARQAAQMIPVLGMAATAFKADMADLAGTSFANFSNLKVPIQQTGRALDIMAAAGKSGAFEIKDMARHMPGLSAQAQALGQSGLSAVADLSAALQIARRATGTSDEAATNVQNLLAKINSPAVIGNFQKRFGVDLPAALRQAYAEGKTPMEALAEITKKATGGDLSKLGFAVEDMQAQSALRALILNLDDYRKMRAQVAASSGTVKQAFQQRELQDASVAWSSFKGSLSALAITLGTTVLPVATAFFRQINSIMSAVSAWAQRNPELARGLITAAGAMGVAKLGLGALQFAFGSIIGPIATMMGWYQKLRTIGAFASIASTAARSFTMLRTAALFLGRGFMQAGIMMMANPIVLIITAIVVAVGLLAWAVYANWDRIKAAWAGISAAFSNGVALVKEKVAGLPGWLKSIGSMMMTGLLSAINPFALATRLIGVAKNGITGFRNFLGIKSPSRVFMAMGGHVAEGLALGIDRGGGRPLRAMGRMAAGVAGAGAIALAAPAMAGPRSAGAGAARSAAAPAAAPITFNIYQREGEDGELLARRIARMIEQQQQRARARSYAED